MSTHDQNSRSAADTSAETLRMALPLMNKYGIPASPENYAVWFHYASGDKPALTERIEALSKQENAFTESVNQALYRNYVSECDLEHLDIIRQQMQQTLLETSGSLQSTSTNTSHYSQVLEEFNNSCGKANSLQDVLGLMGAVLDETREMKSSVETIQRDFESKSEEMDTLRKELDQVRMQASTDPLTGLANRTVFSEALETAIEDATNNEKGGSAW